MPIGDAGQGGALHLWLFHPLDDHRGFPPLEAALTALDTHNAAGRWNKALLDNSARPSGALVYAPKDGGNLTDDQFARLKTELEEGYTGASRAGRPLLLEGGLDWKAMSLSPKDMDFIEAKHSASRDIALAFGVPPMLLGIPGDNTYANYQEANRAFYRMTVLPLVARTVREMSAWLAPAFGPGLRLWYDADQVDGLSAEREALWARLAAASFLSDDEKRQAVGYGSRAESSGSERDETANLPHKWGDWRLRRRRHSCNVGDWRSQSGGQTCRPQGHFEGEIRSFTVVVSSMAQQHRKDCNDGHERGGLAVGRQGSRCGRRLGDLARLHSAGGTPGGGGALCRRPGLRTGLRRHGGPEDRRRTGHRRGDRAGRNGADGRGLGQPLRLVGAGLPQARAGSRRCADFQEWEQRMTARRTGACERKYAGLVLDEVEAGGAFSGYASLFGAVDLGKDMVVRGAFQRSLKERGAAGIRMLYQHDPGEPIGVWTELREDQRGLFVRGQLARNVTRARDVLSLMRTGALDGLSIGFRAVKARKDAVSGVRQIVEADLWEISIVTFPMLPGARVQTVKGGGALPTIRTFERWLTRDAGLTRGEARTVIAKGYANLVAGREAAPGSTSDLVNRLREATRMMNPTRTARQ